MALKDESGQGVVEYALLLVGIAIALAVAFLALGQQASSFFTGLGDKFTHLGR